MFDAISKKIIILILLLTCSEVFARKHVAVVMKVKGKVTKLNPGASKASLVKLGDKLFEDSSIVTGARSFIRIQFIDKTRLSLGPKSKIVVTQIKTTSGSVISLLKGRARTKVTPSKDSGKNKFFIKTRTAALGVRGTDFQTIYNPDNKVTNLLTYKGKVAMANLKDKAPIAKKKIVLERDDSNKIQVKKEAISRPKTESELLESRLTGKQTVLVESGQFSGTLNQAKKVSLPVKINPAQLGILYANENLLEKTSDETRRPKDASSVKKYVRLKQAKQDAPLEGFYDKTTGAYAPKSGGLIDITTGLYVAPEKDAVFDEKNQVYIPKKVGRIEVESGEYIAPKGLSLDARKGFVISKTGKASDKNNAPVLLAMSDKLNKNLDKDLFIDHEEEKELQSMSIFSRRELFTKDIFTFFLGSFDSELTLDSNNSNSAKSVVHNFEGATELGFVWEMAGNGLLRPKFGFKVSGTDYSNHTEYSQKEEKLYSMQLGLSAYLNNRWSLEIDYNIEQENIPTNANGFGGSLEKITLSILGIGVNGVLATHGRLFLGTKAMVFSNFYKSSAELSVKNGVGYYIDLSAGFWHKKHHLYRLSLFNEVKSFDVSGINDAANANYDGFKSSETGLRFLYSYIFE